MKLSARLGSLSSPTSTNSAFSRPPLSAGLTAGFFSRMFFFSFSQARSLSRQTARRTSSSLGASFRKMVSVGLSDARNSSMIPAK